MNPLTPTAIDVVCWDWNGTLLDDSLIALTAMNSVLAERGLPVLPDTDAYRGACSAFRCGASTRA